MPKKVPLIRACGCVHEEYRTVQYLVKPCEQHSRPDLERTPEQSRKVIDGMQDFYGR